MGIGDVWSAGWEGALYILAGFWAIIIVLFILALVIAVVGGVVFLCMYLKALHDFRKLEKENP